MATKDIDWLVIAEKDTQGQDIVKALFDKGSASGILNKGGVIGHNASSILDGTVAVTRFSGHLYSLLWPEDQDAKYSRKSEDVLDEFGFKVGGGWKDDREMLDVFPIRLNERQPKYKIKGANQNGLAKNMSALFKRAKKVIIATDPDPEGEMIYRIWLYNHKGDWGFDKNNTYRVKLGSLDKKSIQKAFKETLLPFTETKGRLAEFYQGLFYRGLARSIADYEYGLTFNLYGSATSNKLSSDKVKGAWGRVKNTLLAWVLDAEKAHDNFVPTSSYRVDVRTANGVLLKSNQIFEKKDDALKFIDQLSGSNQQAIERFSDKSSVTPPTLFSRAELLRVLTKYSAKTDWGAVIQSNYEIKKVLTYPRTDSVHISNEQFDLLKVALQKPAIIDMINQQLDMVEQKGGYDGLSVSFNFEREANKKWVDDEKVFPHFALVPEFSEPLTETKLNALNSDEMRAFKASLFQTFAMFLSDAIDMVHKYRLVLSDDLIFESSFKVPEHQGWRMLLGDCVKTDTLPDISSYDFVVTEVPAKQPSYLTVPSIISRMKSKNVGTSATRDAILLQMLDKGVLYLDKKSALHVNKYLVSSVELLIANGWLDADLTSIWQKQLDDIGGADAFVEFLNKTRSDLVDLNNKVKQAFGK